MKNKIALVLSLTLIIMLFSGCGYKGYSGKDADLFTEAVNSVLWNVGHSSGADWFKDSEIEVIEKDGYGRTLYTYYERYYVGTELSFTALLIAQHSSDGFVYYYEDCNFIIKEQERYPLESVKFTQDEIIKLKAENDWGSEINLEKCIKQEISKTKRKIPYDDQTIIDKAVEKLGHAESGYDSQLYYLTSDCGDNFIVYGAIRRKSGNDSYVYFAVLINSSTDEIKFLIPENVYDYRQELVNFKAENGWEN
ncbi:MAG: hypothetical protein K2L12_06730 [Clostridia bacterium]|nr:hypothetical protein [Clostridia bacterium]